MCLHEDGFYECDPVKMCDTDARWETQTDCAWPSVSGFVDQSAAPVRIYPSWR